MSNSPLPASPRAEASGAPPAKRARLSESRFRNWIFTFNNPPEHWDPDRVGRQPAVRYFSGQYEQAPTTGTIHFQGYVCFHGPKRLAFAQELLETPAAHFEPRRGSHAEADAYVRKPDTRYRECPTLPIGQPPLRQGQRTDLDSVEQAIFDGRTLRDIVVSDMQTFIRYPRGIETAYRLYHSHPRTCAPTVWYFWGETRSGKSWTAWHGLASAEEVASVDLASSSSVWFDAVDPGRHTVLLLDDYYHQFKVSFLLKLLDGYPMEAPVKGGFVNLNVKHIVITSNIPLSEQYPHVPQRVQDALRARIHRDVYCRWDCWYPSSSLHPQGWCSEHSSSPPGCVGAHRPNPRLSH